MNSYVTKTPARGFTLTELLVVMAIIAILASLSLVGISLAKNRSRSSSCKNHLKQMGVWLTQFALDSGEYPLAMNTELTNKYSEHANAWMGTLRRVGGFPDVIQQNDAGDVFNCPSARPPSDLGPNEGYLSYGYNVDGVVGGADDRPLGLGGKGLEAGALYPPPVKAHEVLNPSEMIAIGDSFLGWPEYVVEGRYASVGLRKGVLARSGETTRALRRHDGKGNYVFCDSHVAGISIEKR